ncbi:MAG: hypothetical protein AAGA44_01965 [Pseudomonadota bacterium]
MKTVRVFILAAAGLLSTAASAHLMVAQRGTLNVVDGVAYMVLSVPMSAFHGVDDNGDGAVSMVEFNWHRDDILEEIRRNVRLDDGYGEQSPGQIVLSPERGHDMADPLAPSTQLVVMARFPLAESAGSLRLRVNLFGPSADDQVLQVTAIRRASNERQVIVLSPAQSFAQFFEPGATKS